MIWFKFVPVFRIFTVIAFLILIIPQLKAQEIDKTSGDESRIGSSILNDTTENLYGPTTTQFFYSSTIINNIGKRQAMDTSVYDIHRFSFVDRYEKRYQDLGNIGTAIQPIFYEFSEKIGRSTGFNVYDLYFKDAEDIQFYNTQSPYSRIAMVLGGQGRAITEAEYNRNIDYRSNIGFNYRGIFVDEQIERVRRGDRNVTGVSYNIHGNFHTINRKYWLLAALSRNNHVVDEYGGVRNTSPETPFEDFFRDTVKVRLNNSVARDLRRQYFLYHEYHVSKIMEVFHQFEHYDQLMRFTSDLNADPEDEILPERILTEEEISLRTKPSHVRDRNKFDEWSNKVGLSGTVGDGFYKVYYQNRQLAFDYRYMTFDTLPINVKEQENLAGVMMRIGNNPEKHIIGQFDYLEGGFYNFFGKIAFRPLYGSVRQLKRKPSLLETAYRGTFNIWDINPEAPVTSEVRAGILVGTEKFTIDASLVFQRLTNYIYFTQNELNKTIAQQNTETVTALMPQLRLIKWWGNHFLTKGEIIYSKLGGENYEVYPVPDLFTNFQVSFHDISFKGNLEWQLGIDFHWKSSYFAPAYDPLIQQFYIQDNFETPGAPVIDVFMNAKINRARIFVKYVNLFQVLQGYGYMPTPYYPGQVATFDFGVNWAFYD